MYNTNNHKLKPKFGWSKQRKFSNLTFFLFVSSKIGDAKVFYIIKVGDNIKEEEDIKEMGDIEKS